MSKKIEDIVRRFELSYLEYSQFIGISETYGKVPSYDQKSIDARLEEIKRDELIIDELLTKKDFSEYSSIELQLVKQALKLDHYRFTEEKEYKKYPWYYLSPLSAIEQYYIGRTYAPLTTRIKHIIETEKGTLELLRQASNQLNKTLSKSKVELTFLRARNVIAYLRDELIEEIIKVDDKELIEEWSLVNVQVLEAIEQFIEILKRDYLPYCDDNFALGEKKYLQLLENVERIAIPAKKLLEIAEHDLERNYSSLQEIISEIGLEKFKALREDSPTENELLEWAKIAIKNVKGFILEKDLVTIPDNEECIVKETPGPMRSSTFAALSSSNIAEESDAKESYYYVTPPDKDWTAEEKKEFLNGFNKGALELITAHEVYPGHYLHDKYIKKQTPIVRALGFSILTIEGWAHYTEELVIEQNYNKIDITQAHIGQLIMALMRNCRFLASVKMHCYGMTIEEAKKLFMEKALMSEKAAQMEAYRGTIDAMFLNYNLGKLIIKKLREDYKKKKGEKFNLKEFHNKFLSYGGIPLPMIRKDMLGNMAGVEELL